MHLVQSKWGLIRGLANEKRNKVVSTEACTKNAVGTGYKELSAQIQVIKYITHAQTICDEQI